MTSIVVDPQRLVTCAAHVARAQKDVLAAADNAAGGLAQSGGMAGSDPAGTDWSAAYDPAAARLLGLAGDIADHVGRQVLALNESAAAYHESEAWFGVRADPTLVPALAHGGAPRRTVPEARGGTPFASTDPLAQSVLAVLGMVWPNGDATMLRAASARWTTMADAVDQARGSSLAAGSAALEGMASATIAAATARHRDLDAALGELSAGGTELAAACGDLARHIETAHEEFHAEIRSLAIELGVTVAISALTSLVTAGASTVIGGAATAGRVAIAVSRVAAMVERFASLARLLAAKIGRIKEALDALAGRVARWALGPLPRPARRLRMTQLPDALGKVTDHWAFKLVAEGPSAALSKVLEGRAAALGKGLGESAARRALVLGWRRDLPGVRGILARAAVHGVHGAPAPGAFPLGTPVAPGHRGRHAGPDLGGTHSASRPAREAVAQALAGPRVIEVARHINRVLEKPAEKVPASVSSAVTEGMRHEVRGDGATADDASAVGAVEQEMSRRWTAELGLPDAEKVRFEIPQSVTLVDGLRVDLADKKITVPLGMDLKFSAAGPAGKLAESGVALLDAADPRENWWGKHLQAAEAFRPADGSGAASR